MTHRLGILLPILTSAWLLFGLLAAHAALAQEQSWTVERSIGSANDDAEEFLDGSADDAERWPAGFSYTVSSDLELAHDPLHGGQIVGLRFTDLDIPALTRIDEAVLAFVADSDQSAPLEVTIVAESVPAPDAFNQDADSEASHDLSSRPLTAAAVAWSPQPWTTGQEYRSPNIAPLIQELVNHPDWQSGAGIVIMIRPTRTGGSALRSAYSFDGNRERSPRLLIGFDESAARQQEQPAEAENRNDGSPWTAVAPEQAAQQTPVEPDDSPAAVEQVEAAAPLGQVAEQPGEPRRVRFPLAANFDRGVRGSVLLSDYGAGGTIVTVFLENVSADISYPASIHSGACGSGNRAVVTLEPVAGSRAYSTSLVQTEFDELSAGRYHLNVFRIGDGFTRVAGCAPLGG
ncbi:MAG: hypothetical protein WD314_16625 [Trueperaceae bacterium]